MINNTEAFLEFVDSIITAHAEPPNNPNVWYVNEKKYKQLRWFAHCAKVYHDAPRKLRKCEMRRIADRRKSERKRYE